MDHLTQQVILLPASFYVPPISNPTHSPHPPLPETDSRSYHPSCGRCESNFLRFVTSILLAIFATMQVHAKGEEGKLEVAKKQFAAADVQINKVYQSPLGELSKAKGVELRGRQREWINYRDFIAEDQPRYFRAFEKLMKRKGMSMDPMATPRNWSLFIGKR